MPGVSGCAAAIPSYRPILRAMRLLPQFRRSVYATSCKYIGSEFGTGRFGAYRMRIRSHHAAAFACARRRDRPFHRHGVRAFLCDAPFAKNTLILIAQKNLSVLRKSPKTDIQTLARICSDWRAAHQSSARLNCKNGSICREISMPAAAKTTSASLS